LPNWNRMPPVEAWQLWFSGMVSLASTMCWSPTPPRHRKTGNCGYGFLTGKALDSRRGHWSILAKAMRQASSICLPHIDLPKRIEQRACSESSLPTSRWTTMQNPQDQRSVERTRRCADPLLFCHIVFACSMAGNSNRACRPWVLRKTGAS